MTDDVPGPVEDALDDHDAFEPADDGYRLETTVFDAMVTATPTDGPRDGHVHVTISLPTLDAAVADETVPAVVEDDWFETLKRRLTDAFSVTRSVDGEGPAVDREGETVRVTLEFVAWDAREGIADAKALIEFVEGTYAQGLVPGYEYRGPAGELVASAAERGQGAAGDGPPL